MNDIQHWTQGLVEAVTYWGTHAFEGLGFTAISFGLAICAILLLWKMKGIVFHYADELDILANAIRDRNEHGDPKKFTIDQKYKLGIACLPLALFSAAKLIAIGVLAMAIVDAAS